MTGSLGVFWSDVGSDKGDHEHKLADGTPWACRWRGLTPIQAFTSSDPILALERCKAMQPSKVAGKMHHMRLGNRAGTDPDGRTPGLWIGNYDALAEGNRWTQRKITTFRKQLRDVLALEVKVFGRVIEYVGMIEPTLYMALPKRDRIPWLLRQVEWCSNIPGVSLAIDASSFYPVVDSPVADAFAVYRHLFEHVYTEPSGGHWRRDNFRQVDKCGKPFVGTHRPLLIEDRAGSIGVDLAFGAAKAAMEGGADVYIQGLHPDVPNRGRLAA